METTEAKKIDNRTGIDFSKNILTTTLYGDVMRVDEFKRPNSIIHGLTFVNTHGHLTVSGDFGNWVFCREFHPSKDGGVSSGYWIEKLSIASTQEARKYDAEQTEKEIREMLASEEGISEERKEWLEELLTHIDDELDFTYCAYREKPDDMEYENVPFGKVTNQWLLIVFDAFDEMCNRIKENNYTLIRKKITDD